MALTPHQVASYPLEKAAGPAGLLTPSGNMVAAKPAAPGGPLHNAWDPRCEWVCPLFFFVEFTRPKGT